MPAWVRPGALVPMCLLFGGLAAAEEAWPAALTVEPGGFFEVAALAKNAHRTPGGNEEHYGDFVAGVNLDVVFKPSPARALTALGMHLSYVPVDSLLDYADPQKASRHNQNWLRADGILSRPYLLAHLQADFGARHCVRVRLGGFLASGLEPLDGSPNMYYLTMPAPLLLSQRWDKGFDLTYRFCPRGARALTVGLGVLDGDWAVGEASLARTHDSAANSYPSWAGRFEIRPLALASEPSLERRVGAITLGLDASIGEQGSYWAGSPPLAEKRRQNNAIGYLGWSRTFGECELDARAFLARMERNPLGNGSGSHVPAVETRGYGIEVALRKLLIGSALLDLYCNAWRMNNGSGVADGEIWPALSGLSTDTIRGFLVGVRWAGPALASSRITTFVGLSFGQIVPDVPDAWGSSKGLRNLIRLVCTVRL